ncbi:hypothetical protein C3E97_027665 [Pseudomonas sp. MWU12-2115]|uniref:hypothetical protein n=1 Tax=unclassified Pseudomonas TaxID=196821 RepID=UPI000CD57C05|nr:hypothetical protein [Pseudomonas sp. MWU12-2020]RBB97497.1 hypothetical protein C3E97_027665 [Pseudomonas sp. MWU12-2115]
MTNNPTIDGVSRELLERLFEGFKQGNWYAEAQELRALLDAPVVERQPVAWIEIDEDKPAGKTIDWYNSDLLEIPLGTKLYVAPPEVAALQSTIAQLQARVEELESGRDEPFAWVVVSPEFGILSDLQTTEDDAKDLAHDMDCELPAHHSGGKHEIKALFTAPPAPVAVALPDQKILSLIVMKAARQTDLIAGANYHTAAELAAGALMYEITALNTK